MLYLSNIREAREAQKLRLTTLSRQLRVHRDTIQRLETGKEIDQLTDIARLLGFNICLLTDQEVEIIAQFNAILAKNEQKSTN
jgi:predicted transcriptional regulator